jgi:signal transduction histidine kinase
MSARRARRKRGCGARVKTNLENTGQATIRLGLIAWSAVIASLLLHLVAAFQFSLIEKSLGLPELWGPQFYGLVCASFALNLAVIAARNGLVRIGLLCVRLLVYVLIGFPLGRNISIEICLQCALLIDIVFHSGRLIGIVFPALLIAVSWFTQRPLLAWDVMLAEPSPIDVSTLIATGLATLLLAQLAAYGERRFSLVERRNRQLAQTIDQLTDANLGFQKYAASVGKTSIMEERNRVSREVHDTIGYTLTNLIIMLEACQDLIDNDSVSLRRMLLRAGELAQDGMNDTRRALHALRQSGVEDVRGLRAIKKLVDAFQSATGIPVEIEYGNIPWNMDEQIEQAIYRMLQEGMTNAFKHGKASRIMVYFWKTDRSIIVNVRDNGTGSKEIKEGIGISGMRERIEAAGGEIAARNTSDGFELSAHIPLRSAHEGIS